MSDNDIQTKRKINTFGLVRNRDSHWFCCIVCIAARNIVKSKRHTYSFVCNQTKCCAHIAPLTVQERVRSSQLEPMARTESSTESQFLVYAWVNKTCLRIQTYTYAIVPEVSIHTNINTWGSHTCETIFAFPILLESIAVYFSQTWTDSIGQALGVKRLLGFVVIVFVFQFTHTSICAINLVVITHTFVPYNKSKVGYWGCYLYHLVRLIGHTEVDSGTQTLRLNQSHNVHIAVRVLGKTKLGILDVVQTDWCWIAADRRCNHRIAASLQVPFLRRSVEVKILITHTSISVSVEEFHLTTHSPLLIDRVHIANAEFSINREVQT